MRSDLTKTGQRWYCNCCGSRYKTKFGMLIEIIIGEDTQAMYCKAELPPPDIQDAKNMMIQRTFKHCSTPSELLAAIPVISPLDRSEFLRATEDEAVFKFDDEMYQGLKLLEWYQLYNLA